MATAGRVSKLAVEFKTGETLRLGGVDSPEIRLTLLHKHGQVARVLVQAPESIKITPPAKRTG